MSAGRTRVEIVILGDLASGKTQLYNRLCQHQSFNASHRRTFGHNHSGFQPYGNFNFIYWDTDEEKINVASPPSFISTANIFLCVLDLTKANGLETLLTHIDVAMNYCKTEDYRIFIVGTKLDSNEIRVISNLAIKAFLKTHQDNAHLENIAINTSAKDSINIDEIREHIHHTMCALSNAPQENADDEPTEPYRELTSKQQLYQLLEKLDKNVAEEEHNDKTSLLHNVMQFHTQVEALEALGEKHKNYHQIGICCKAVVNAINTTLLMPDASDELKIEALRELEKTALSLPSSKTLRKLSMSMLVLAACLIIAGVVTLCLAASLTSTGILAPLGFASGIAGLGLLVGGIGLFNSRGRAQNPLSKMNDVHTVLKHEFRTHRLSIQ